MPRSNRIVMNPPRFIKGGIRIAPRRREPSNPFLWPLGPINDFAPRVLAAHEGDRPSVDLGYPQPVGEIPVFATNDGEVSLALEDRSGCAVSVDHGGTWCTHYTGLTKLAVTPCLPRLKRRQSVCAGDLIGYTTNKLGFELWQWTDERGFVAIDPRLHLPTWKIPPVFASPTQKEAA